MYKSLVSTPHNIQDRATPMQKLNGDDEQNKSDSFSLLVRFTEQSFINVNDKRLKAVSTLEMTGR